MLRWMLDAGLVGLRPCVRLHHSAVLASFINARTRADAESRGRHVRRALVALAAGLATIALGAALAQQPGEVRPHQHGGAQLVTRLGQPLALVAGLRRAERDGA